MFEYNSISNAIIEKEFSNSPERTQNTKNKNNYFVHLLGR